MGEKVTKSIDPDEIVERDVNQSGQIYLGRDLAGESVTVAYEVDRAESAETPSTSSASPGATKHRYLLEQCISTLNQLGISECSISNGQGMRSIPDAVAKLPWGSSVDDQFAPGIRNRIAKESDMRIEALTSTKKPVRILSYLNSAIRDSKTLVLVVSQEADIAKLDEIIYSQSVDGTISYDEITCRDTSESTNQFYTIDRRRFLDHDYDSSIFPVWIERDDRIICVPNEEPNTTPLAVFNPETREIHGQAAEVVSPPTGESPPDHLTPVRLPYVPKSEFDRLPQYSDFSILLFPESDRASGQPHLYQKGERIPVFNTE